MNEYKKLETQQNISDAVSLAMIAVIMLMFVLATFAMNSARMKYERAVAEMYQKELQNSDVIKI